MSAAELMIEAVSRLAVSAGDTVVLRADRALHAEQVAHIRSIVRATLPAGVNCLVLDGGLRVGVLASMGRPAADGQPLVEERLREIAGRHDAECMHCDLELEAAAELERLRRAEATSALQLADVREALRQYHESLRRREHGGVAAGRAIDAIAQILGS